MPEISKSSSGFLAGGCYLLVALASDHDDSPGFLVHAPQQQHGEQPVAEIVRREGGIEAIVGPRLPAKILKAGSKDQRADRRGLAGGDASLAVL